MGIFRINNNQNKELTSYNFQTESELQDILYTSPEIIYSVPQLELVDAETAFIIKEYTTGRGSIDILIITKNGDILLLETKLVRNSEAIRTVVAQVVDYIKAIVSEGVDPIINNLSRKNVRVSNDFIIDDKFRSVLARNVNSGNIYGIIIGDDIHPNLLGMVESIQSAPHLSFHLNLVKVEAFTLEDGIIINAVNVENTKEIERSVIRITFDPDSKKLSIDSEAPVQDGKGSKPLLKWEEYINSVSSEYRNIISGFKSKWQSKVEDSISMGTTGFSAGVKIGQRRIPLLFIYDDYLYLISEKSRISYNIPDEVYNIYKKEIEKVPVIYDRHLISNKVAVKFNEMSETEFEIILNASIICADELKKNYIEKES